MTYSLNVPPKLYTDGSTNWGSVSIEVSSPLGKTMVNDFLKHQELSKQKFLIKFIMKVSRFIVNL